MNFGRILTMDCVNVVPPPDDRCSDQAFAIAHPDICPVASSLIIKPAVALVCQLGSVQFKAFVIENGHETEVTDQSIFSSSDLTVAMVGAVSGNATGIQSGSTTISASYKGKLAQSQMTVLTGTTCCDAQTVAMMVVIDTTRSMSQQFNANYATKLDYAKFAANRFIGEVNAAKDVVGLMSFAGTNETVLASPSSDKAAVAALLVGVVQTQEKTEFFDVVQAAIAELAAVSADRKIIVLMSDGEDTLTTTWDSTTDPLVPINDFKNLGGIVICLGVRASGAGYLLLSAMATGGFFINAYDATAETSLNFLSGLKGYVCAGNCTPAGDVSVASGQNNYTGFINWEVTDGAVDLCGNGFNDFLPGHGLYVDLAGTDPMGLTGRLVSMVPFALQAGKTYQLSLDLAGNQRIDESPYSARIQVFWKDGGGGEHYLLNEQVFVNNFTQPFTNYSFAFTANSDYTVYIGIKQESIPADASAWVGLLLDNVKFVNQTDLITLLNDTFDGENIKYVPPACGVGTTWLGPGIGYAVGYECDGEGCLTEPPPAQLPDPAPLNSVETDYTPPRIYTSTKTVCLSCPPGQQNLVTLIPPMTGYSSAVCTVSASTESANNRAWYMFTNGSPAIAWSPAAGAIPAWVMIDFAAAKTVTAYGIINEAPGIGFYATDWQFQGSNDGTNWTTLDTQVGIIPTGYPSEDKYQVETPQSFLHYRLYITGSSPQGAIPANYNLLLWHLALYGYEGAVPPVQVCSTKTATSTVSQQDADNRATDAATTDAQSQLNCSHTYTSTKQYTAHCDYGCFGETTRSATATSYISQEDADNKALEAAVLAAETALDCTGSNNDQPITLPVGGWNQFYTVPASPFPSVKNVTLAGAITKVTVTLQNLQPATNGDSWIIFLRAPDGTTVLLWSRHGSLGSNIPNAVTITFDDAAGSTIPSGPAALTSGSYKPTNDNSQPSLAIPASAPQPPYSLSLAAFNGIDPNGCWSLWCQDRQTVATQILGGWSLDITTDVAVVLYALGDLHTKANAQAINQTLSALVPLPQDGLAGMIILGDVGSEPTSLTAWQNFWAWGWAPLTSRILFVVGNHDWLVEAPASEANTKSFWAGTLAAVYGSTFPGSLTMDPSGFNYSVKYANRWKIIVINSEAYEDTPGALNVGGVVYNWLLTQLNDANTHYIFATHRSRWADDTTHGDLADLDDIWRLAVQYHVTAWLSGHSHVAEVGANRDADGNVVASGGTVELRNGTGNPNLYPFQVGYTPPGSWLWEENTQNVLMRLTLTDTNLTVEYLDDTGALIPASVFTIPAL